MFIVIFAAVTCDSFDEEFNISKISIKKVCNSQMKQSADLVMHAINSVTRFTNLKSEYFTLI